MAKLNHELKTTARDKPGYLIDKFDSSGKIIITVYTDVFSNKISFKLSMNTKDLYEHLLKPTSPSPLVSINGKLEENVNVMFFPAVFPNGVVESLTMFTDNYSNIESFEVACYGNDSNVLTGAKQWFYVSSNTMNYDGECSYKFNNSVMPSIVPYSYNFIALRIKFKPGGYVLGNVIDSVAKERFKDLDIQWGANVSLAGLKTVPADVVKTDVDVVPFIQFNLLKAN